MTPGERIHEGASLLVTRTKAVPAHIQSRVREISRVETAPSDRRKGHATRLMRMVCDEADKRGMLLLLEAKPYESGGMDAARLECWYACFGFVPLQAEPRILARPPGGKWQAPEPRRTLIAESVNG